MSLPALATIRPHVALATILVGVSACASGPSQAPGTAGLAPATPAAMQSAASAPVLLSCPAGQQALIAVQHALTQAGMQMDGLDLLGADDTRAQTGSRRGRLPASSCWRGVGRRGRQMGPGASCAAVRA